MARQPEVFVRALEPPEAQRLVKITRTARDRVRLRRAGIVLASVQGRSAADAAAMFAATPQYAREVIHAFNEQGFAALDPKWSGGRPRRFGPAVREIVCRVAKTTGGGDLFLGCSIPLLEAGQRDASRGVAASGFRACIGRPRLYLGVAEMTVRPWHRRGGSSAGGSDYGRRDGSAESAGC
jgi:hypothetical protein